MEASGACACSRERVLAQQFEIPCVAPRIGLFSTQFYAEFCVNIIDLFVFGKTAVSLFLICPKCSCFYSVILFETVVFCPFF